MVEIQSTLEIGLFEDMSKQEQIDHLRDFHFDGKNLLAYAWSSYTKDDLVRIHTDMHAGRWANYIRGNSLSKSLVPHEHTNFDTSALTSTVQEQLDALGIDKPLSSQQKKALLDLLNNDFATLSAELDVYADEKLASRKEEARKEGETKAPVLAEFQTKARALSEECHRETEKLKALYEEKANALLEEAESNGITTSYNRQTGYKTMDRIRSFVIKGLSERYQEIEKETRAEISVARNALNREKLVATRKIMLAAIPRDSAKLIDKMPSAANLMREAATARAATRQLEAAEK